MKPTTTSMTKDSVQIESISDPTEPHKVNVATKGKKLIVAIESETIGSKDSDEPDEKYAS